MDENCNVTTKRSWGSSPSLDAFNGDQSQLTSLSGSRLFRLSDPIGLASKFLFGTSNRLLPAESYVKFEGSTGFVGDPLLLPFDVAETQVFIPSGVPESLFSPEKDSDLKESNSVSNAEPQENNADEEDDDEEKPIFEDPSELPSIAEHADDLKSEFSDWKQGAAQSLDESSDLNPSNDPLRVTNSYPENLVEEGFSEDQASGDEFESPNDDGFRDDVSLRINPSIDEDSEDVDFSQIVRKKRGRSLYEPLEEHGLETANNEQKLLEKCRSQIIEPISKITQIEQSQVKEIISLDRSMSQSTPSIDSAGQDQGKNANGSTVATTKHSKSRNSTIPPKPTKNKQSSGSNLPSWAMMTPRPMTIAASTKNSKPSRSHSTVSVQDTESKEKPIKRNASNFLSRIGMARTSSRTKQDKKRPTKSHIFIPASISNSAAMCEVCRKPLAKSISAASQCDKCEILVHESCRKEAGHCIKWTKQPHQPRLKPTVEGQGAKHVKRISSACQENGELAVNGETNGVTEKEDSGDSADEKDDFAPSLRPDRSFPPLVLPEWEELRLWQPEPEVWSVAYKQYAKKLSSNEVRKQDVIHELYITEKHHCETLVMLKQTYRKMLEEKGILSDSELDRLLPNALDDLWRFHSKFLTLLQYKREEVTVSAVHEILTQHFTGPEALAAMDAYAQFCSAKESANALYKELMLTKSTFRLLMEHVTRFPLYKDHSLQDCLLLVTQRLTKYSVLVDAIYKKTDSKESEGMKAAVVNVKGFIAKVDQGVQKLELRRHWDDIKGKLEDHISTTLHNNPFSAEDLKRGDRELLCSGNIQWQNAARKPTAVKMLLFTDLIVFLQSNGSKYWLFAQDNHEAVMSVRKLLVRERAGRPPGIFLISTGKKPDMYEIICQTKNDLARWLRVLDYAVKNCPDTDLLYGGAESEASEKINELMQEMRRIFEDRLKCEEKLKDYFDAQVAWYKEAKVALEKLCVGTNRDMKDRISGFLEEEFSKIRLQQESHIKGYMNSSAQLLRGSLEEAVAKTPNKPDESLAPRRVFTFNAPGDKTYQMRKSGAIRRNTTVPKLKPDYAVVPGEKDRESEEDDDVDAVGSILNSEEVLEWWIKELKDIKDKNERLENELSMKRAEAVVSHSEAKHHVAMEKLRQAQAELQAQQRATQNELENQKERLEDRETQLLQKEVELDRRETEVQNMWKAWQKKTEQQLPGASETLAFESPDSGISMNSVNRGPVMTSASTSKIERRPSQPLMFVEGCAPSSEPELRHSIATDTPSAVVAGHAGLMESKSQTSIAGYSATARPRAPQHMQYSLLNQPKDGNLPKQQLPSSLLHSSSSTSDVHAGTKTKGRRTSNSPNRSSHGGIISNLLYKDHHHHKVDKEQAPSQILPKKLKEETNLAGKKKKK